MLNGFAPVIELTTPKTIRVIRRYMIAKNVARFSREEACCNLSEKNDWQKKNVVGLKQCHIIICR